MIRDDEVADDKPLGSRPDDHPKTAPSGLRVPQRLLWALAVLVVVLVAAGWVALSREPSRSQAASDVVRLTNSAPGSRTSGLDTSSAMIEKPAPAVSWPAFTGGDATMASLKGQPVVLNFWSSTCTPCITEMPEFEKVHQKLGDKVTFVGLASVDQDEGSRALAAKTGVTYTLGFDRDGKVAQQFGAIGLPTTVLIDREGVIVQTFLGAVSADDLSAAIQEKLRP